MSATTDALARELEGYVRYGNTARADAVRAALRAEGVELDDDAIETAIEASPVERAVPPAKRQSR